MVRGGGVRHYYCSTVAAYMLWQPLRYQRPLRHACVHVCIHELYTFEYRCSCTEMSETELWVTVTGCARPGRGLVCVAKGGGSRDARNTFFALSQLCRQGLCSYYLCFSHSTDSLRYRLYYFAATLACCCSNHPEQMSSSCVGRCFRV